MSTGSAYLYHTSHPSSAGEVQHCFPTELRPKEGDTQASAKEAGNKPIISATTPLHCLPTWVSLNFGIGQSTPVYTVALWVPIRMWYLTLSHENYTFM